MLKKWCSSINSNLDITFHPNKQDSLSGNLEMTNNNADAIFLKMHRTLGTGNNQKTSVS